MNQKPDLVKPGEDPPRALLRLLNANISQIENVLPKHLKPDRLIRLAVTALHQSPQLQNCDMLSICNSVMLAAQLGLEINNGLGHGYLIPYKTACTFQPGYRGLIDLALRSGKIHDIEAHVVRERDVFVFELGDKQKLEHRPFIGEWSDWIGVYSYIKFKEGPPSFEFMFRKEIEELRDKHGNITKWDQGARVLNEDGPWFRNPEEMAKKTVAKRHLKWKKLSPELDLAIGLDEQADIGPSQDHVLDTSFEQMAADASRNLQGSARKAEEKGFERIAEVAAKITSMQPPAESERAPVTAEEMNRVAVEERAKREAQPPTEEEMQQATLDAERREQEKPVFGRRP